MDITLRPGVEAPLARRTLVRAVVGALAAAEAPARTSLGLILSDDSELAALNQQHMGHQGPTDVLSFPLLAAGTQALEGAPQFALPPGSRPHLGDVVVSVERARAQALEGRGGQTGDVSWSVADEVRLLVVHGTLHICGWDHARPEEEAAMRSLERRILEETR